MLRKKVKLNKSFLPPLIWGLLIFVGASIPTFPLEKLRESNKIFDVFFSDISFHFVGFGLFAWFLCAGFFKQKKHALPYYRIGFYSFSFGVFIELYQIFLPYRHFSVLDLAVDCAGIGSALILFRHLLASRRSSV